MDVFTSIPFKHLPKASVLAYTLKLLHPGWTFHLCISDHKSSGLDANFESNLFDRIIWIEEVDIENLYPWIFKHSVAEVPIVIKWPIALYLLENGSEKLMYLDPDIAIFHPLHDIERLLDTHTVVLTPHLLEHEYIIQTILNNEISILNRSNSNLGFFALSSKTKGKRFAKWFSQRLLEFFDANMAHSLLTDQDLSNLPSGFFPDLYILRDPGYNVASWNLSKRSLSFSRNGTILVSGSPIKFYNFTGFDSGVGAAMAFRRSEGNHILSEIWTWYRLQMQRYGHEFPRSKGVTK